jgi:ligand-binding SRPBCC domain-containing protein
MPLIELQTQIRAPIERVFDLARSIDAHMASTEGTSERAVAGRTSGLIEDGEAVTWEARHFGITQRLSVRITAFERPVLFCDEMLSGAFSEMRHIHRFSEGDGRTMMKDEFYFSAPLGILGRIAERLFLSQYMKTFLSKRAIALKRLAESNDWQRYIPTKAEQVADGNRPQAPQSQGKR